MVDMVPFRVCTHARPYIAVWYTALHALPRPRRVPSAALRMPALYAGVLSGTLRRQGRRRCRPHGAIASITRMLRSQGAGMCGVLLLLLHRRSGSAAQPAQPVPAAGLL